ncbi:putative prophage DNA primase [Escherichia coli]|nr:putative prophage DNA primase [Escherichia coli]
MSSRAQVRPPRQTWRAAYTATLILRLTWYGTALGLANEAAAHNDGLMPLDEVGQGADPVSVSQSAYALFNGVGKLQGAKMVETGI